MYMQVFNHFNHFKGIPLPRSCQPEFVSFIILSKTTLFSQPSNFLTDFFFLAYLSYNVPDILCKCQEHFTQKCNHPFPYNLFYFSVNTTLSMCLTPLSKPDFLGSNQKQYKIFQNYYVIDMQPHLIFQLILLNDWDQEETSYLQIGQ